MEHQLSRLRTAKQMPDSEAEGIFQALSQSVQSYEQVVEVSSGISFLIKVLSIYSNRGPKLSFPPPRYLLFASYT